MQWLLNAYNENQIACLKVNYLNQGIRTAERITLSKILLQERKIEIGL